MLHKINADVKCDVRDCKNLAEVYLEVKGRWGRCYLCADCLGKLSREGTSLTAPKSPKNTIKRLAEEREKQVNLK